MTESLRVGIVGCGRMGRQHAFTSRALGHEVVVLSDPDPARVAALAVEFPAASPATQVGSLDWSSLDAVFVCTPPFARGPVELAATEAGVPFFVEKPVGLDASCAVPALRSLRRRPIVHAVGYMNRYRHSVQQARAAVAGRRLIGLTAQWLTPPYEKDWWLRGELSGGPFNEQATHLIDLCRFFGGEIVAVSAVGTDGGRHHGLLTTVGACCRFESGACATILYSFLSSDKQISIKVLASDAVVELHGWQFQLSAAPDTTAEDPFVVEVTRFFDAVMLGRPDLVESDLFDATRTQLVVDAIRAALGSAETVVVRSLSSLLEEPEPVAVSPHRRTRSARRS